MVFVRVISLLDKLCLYFCQNEPVLGSLLQETKAQNRSKILAIAGLERGLRKSVCVCVCVCALWVLQVYMFTEEGESESVCVCACTSDAPGLHVYGGE